MSINRQNCLTFWLIIVFWRLMSCNLYFGVGFIEKIFFLAWFRFSWPRPYINTEWYEVPHSFCILYVRIEFWRKIEVFYVHASVWTRFQLHTALVKHPLKVALKWKCCNLNSTIWNHNKLTEKRMLMGIWTHVVYAKVLWIGQFSLPFRTFSSTDQTELFEQIYINFIYGIRWSKFHESCRDWSTFPRFYTFRFKLVYNVTFFLWAS